MPTSKPCPHCNTYHTWGQCRVNATLFPAPKGWECPKCGRCFAPWVSECSHCGKVISQSGNPDQAKVTIKGFTWKPRTTIVDDWETKSGTSKGIS